MQIRKFESKSTEVELRGIAVNDIEFKLIREELHLSQTELAELWGVALRTLQRWEKGDFNIPKERQEELYKMILDVYKSVQNFLEVLNENTTDNKTTLVLLAYNQWTYDGDFPHYKIHYSSIAKCQSAAEKIGFKVRIVKFKPTEYTEWLAGRKDTQAMRSMWASLQV